MRRSTRYRKIAAESKKRQQQKQEQLPKEIPVGQSMWDRFIRFFKGDH